MKKSIGLTANTSDFRPSLPQTRHLNYFMGTNPVYMAGGGDVKAGIPNYPDVNVTRGFLPAALGFVEGGEATGLEFFKNLLRQFDNDFTKLLNFLQNILGFSEEKSTDIINQITGEEGDAAKFQGSEQGKAIADAFDYAGQGSGQSTGAPTVTPKDTVTDLDDELTEHLRKLNLIGMGGYYGAPPATSQITPGIGPRLETSPGESSGAPQDTGGITEIKPESKNPLDLNGDGEVNMKDLEYAKNNPLLSWAIPALKKALGIVDEKLEEWADKDEKEEVVPKVPEGLPPTHPEFPGKKPIVTKEPEGIIPKIKRKPEKKDEITKLPPISAEQERREDEDKWTGIGSDEMKLFKLLAAERAKKTGQPDSGGITDKKDVPAWALPMMSAGFAMMASKSPYFMQALGEGGQKGLETFAAQKTAEEEKLDKESERKLRESQSKYYETRTQKPDIKVMTVDGRGVYHRWDDATQDYVSLNRIAIPSDADIETELSEGVHALSWATYTTEKKQELIAERRNRYLGIVQSNLSAVEEKGGKWSLADLLTLIGKGDAWLESQANKKDGGIVTLRR